MVTASCWCVQIGGLTLAQAGCKPILHMNDFMKDKELPPALVADITSR